MKILIVDDVHEILTEGLKQLGHEVSYYPDIKRNELIELITDYEGLIIRTKTQIDESVLCNAEKLKFIGRAGAGIDNIDTDYCDAKGIHYFNAGEANADAVGEQAVGMLLALFANIVKADAEVRNIIWDREGNRGVELKGKTVGIIGYGNTGKAVAAKLKGFKVNVLAYDKYLINYSDTFASEATLEEIFEQADIVSFHVPLTEETMYMGDSSFINCFKKNIWLLNLSRGKVVKLEDLVTEIKRGKVLGAGLDVLENENLKTMNEKEQTAFDYLRNSGQTILTPHVGGWTKESYEKISEVLLQKIKELR